MEIKIFMNYSNVCDKFQLKKSKYSKTISRLVIAYLNIPRNFQVSTIIPVCVINENKKSIWSKTNILYIFTFFPNY